jgi:hypothetical protein
MSYDPKITKEKREITVRLSNNEYRFLIEEADFLGMDVAGYIRHLIKDDWLKGIEVNR